MFERFTSRQGARDRITVVNSRQKPFRSGSIQHMVPVAPVWPKTFGPSVSLQLREVPREFRLQPSPPRPRSAHGVGNVWLIDEAVGRHCLHRARRQQPNIAVRSAVEKQLTDDRKFITACSASSRSSGAKPSQSISAHPVKPTRKHQFNLTYPFAQSLLRAPLPAPAQKP
ncbi:MAG: hypothetical protein ACI8P0_004887 [Planctomycetaceae bacterium]|jgi:hypothetical protein